MENAISTIILEMQPILSPSQVKQLSGVLRRTLHGVRAQFISNERILDAFLSAKTVEGCSFKTIDYYRNTLSMMTDVLAKPYSQITSDDLRRYLNDYEARRHSSKVTIDNIRRIMSSFFSWLEDEDYIVKSPVRRIKRVKTAIVAKETFTDEQLESIRISCRTARDLAIVDLLASTGMRVGELVGLDRADIDFRERECIVTGKGNKQRPV